jgi:hypothetical protein
MAQCAALTTISDGNTATAVTVMANENLVRSAYNVHDIATGGVHGIVAPDTIASGAAQNVMKLQDVPIGSIIPFYDFNGGLTFDTTYWAYCNGQTVAVGSLGAQTLPDLSNRYLVGFGTEAGGDNGSAAWATAAVGVASHTVNLSHIHRTSFSTAGGGNDDLWGYKSDGTPSPTGTGLGDILLHSSIRGSSSGGFEINWPTSGTLYHYSSTEYAVSGSTTPLFTTQSIQPRSISVRFIMRIL